MRYYLQKQKSINILILPKSFFYPWVNISFNFRAKKSYYIPNQRKLYEESAELGRLALAALDQELQPRKPVHFFMLQTLYMFFYTSKFVKLRENWKIVTRLRKGTKGIFRKNSTKLVKISRSR